MSAVAFRGTALHAKGYGAIEILEDRVLVVSSAASGGRILAIEEGAKQDAVLGAHGVDAHALTVLAPGQLLIPGFVDTHVHAPQYSYTGTATDLPLMRWLDHYTFPREAALQDLGIARREYSQLIARLLAAGTTTVLYFATLHLAPTLLFADLLHAAGQRACVGKVCMDRNSPPEYVATTQANLEDAEAAIQYVQGLGSPLLRPVITPRFVPSCTPELLQGLGDLAAKYPEALVQSHISESHDAVAFSRALHPEVDGRDAQLFDKAGLLTDKAVFAHAVCLNDEELRLFSQRGASIAHCPLSNFFYADELLRVNHVKGLGVKVGLGTDVAGGYSPSMLSSIRLAVVTGRALRVTALAGQPPGSGAAPSPADQHLLDYKAAFWLATVGGAEALGLAARIGTFEVGKDFDALLVDTHSGATFDVSPQDTLEDKFQKFVNLGDDRNILGVWVAGRRVAGAQPA